MTTSRSLESDAPFEIFISYAHADTRLREALERHLALLRRAGVISIWHSRDIDAGKDWRDEIDVHLESAQVILALVSPSFMASEYCYEIEMRRALERHDAREARLVPVILRPVDWQSSPLGRLQALPESAKPVTAWRDRDAALAAVASGLRRLLGSPAEDTPGIAKRQAVWHVPHHRNPNFTGRNDLLDVLRETFVSGAVGETTQILSGLAGVGKTQIAAEYAHRYAADYQMVWWAAADEAATLPAEFGNLAAQLRLEVDPTNDVQLIEVVREWLEHRTDWLLVFDDARDTADLRPYLPRRPLGHVLITSRNPTWRGVGRPRSVPVLEREHSVSFLLRRTGEHDAAAAARLAASLGDLPLALEQAGAYVEETGRSLATYLELFGSHRHELMSRASSQGHSAGIRAVWELSLQEVESRAPAAADLLILAAHFDADNIPLTSFIRHAELLPTRLRDAMRDPLSLDQTLHALRRYSLLEVVEPNASMHALVQDFVRDRLEETERRAWAEIAALLAYELFVFQRDTVERWRDAAALLPHVLAVTTHAEDLDVAAAVTARLRDQAGVDVRRGAELSRARELFERAVEADERTFGPDHARVATTIGHLAAALEAAGDLPGAKEQYERALTIDERFYGEDDPTVATDASKLAEVLQALGETHAARLLYKRALAIDEQAFGVAHPLVAGDLGALAGALEREGEREAAEACHLRALDIEEQVYGESHPKVAARLSRIAAIRAAEGDHAAARGLRERALAISELAYGPYETAIAERALELAETAVQQGNIGRACELYAQALRIQEEALGADHPRTAETRRTLASLRGRQPARPTG